MRNAILFAAAFAVMLFAPLTPYITVGAFIVSMMLLSALNDDTLSAGPDNLAAGLAMTEKL